MTGPRVLFNEDGEPLTSDLASIGSDLSQLSNDERIEYRNSNARSIANHESDRILIVAGPGSGKSTLFRDRIKHWIPLHPNESICVSSFVRKLVHDLDREIQNDAELAPEDRERVTVSTLHGLARSLIERNSGTSNQPMAPHIRMIATERWMNMVWADVLLFHDGRTSSDFDRHELERQFHTEKYDSSAEWRELRTTYLDICRFFNAVGFADMIVFARKAVDENPELVVHLLWIIDEFQDFNPAEDHLIRAVINGALGVLIAGDDDQAIYQNLKASRPELICGYYEDRSYSKAMLPFCSRCDHFICLAAEAFIERRRSSSSIKKIFMPLRIDETLTKVQVVATIGPSSAVDYISKFISDHRAELDAHEEQMRAGNETDPFLLVLTPAKDVRFYRGPSDPDKQLLELLNEWSPTSGGRSEDYRKIQTFCSVAWYPYDNLAIRQALDYRGIRPEAVHPYIEEAMKAGLGLVDVLRSPHDEVLDIAAQVAELAVLDDLSGIERAERISDLIGVRNKLRLAEELEAHPISAQSNLADDEAEEAIATAGSVAAVELMTMFQSKGLSAQHVIVIGCDETNLDRTDELTFFVALTRARRSLHLLTSLKAGGSEGPHPFVLDLPEECCDFLSYKKGTRSSDRLSGQQGFLDQLSRWHGMVRKK